MKRFSLREFLLLCAPIALIGVVLFVARILNPPRDPDAVVKLVVRQIPSNYSLIRQRAPLQFAWQADAKDGPEPSCRLGYREQIVAIGPGGETVIYADPPLPGNVAPYSSASGGGSTPGQSEMWSRDVQLDTKAIPLTAKRFEWRGEFVAVPQSQGTSSTAETPATLAKWAVIKGAARVKKTIAIRFDATHYAIRALMMEPVNATNASKGVDTCITVETLDQDRAVCHRLVAFDGKTRRMVWQEGITPPLRLQWSEEGGSWDGLNRSHLLLRLRDVPQSWGAITYLYDVVFSAKPMGIHEERVDMKTLAALQRAGGIRLSRRLLVRRAGQTITVPRYQRSPNFKLLRVQTRPLGARSQILLTLEYLAAKADPEVDVPGGVDFFDSKGKWLNLMETLSVKSGARPKEWVLTVETKNHAPNLACQMQTEIADGAAAPLKVTQKMVLP